MKFLFKIVGLKIQHTQSFGQLYMEPTQNCIYQNSYDHIYKFKFYTLEDVNFQGHNIM
jgi:hypothetical protein